MEDHTNHNSNGPGSRFSFAFDCLDVIGEIVGGVLEVLLNGLDF